jgi:AcrR family transcriptional regulator
MNAPISPIAAVPAVRPQRADARRNRGRILDAARSIFARSGRLAQIDEIAHEAGVGVGTVYRHFATKEALMGELVARHFETFTVRGREALAAGGDPWEAFAGLLRRNTEDMAEDVALKDAVMRIDGVWAYVEPAQRELLEVTGELVARGQRAGVIRPDLTVDEMPMLMCGLSATMSMPGMDWRRHLELLLDGLRA